MARASYRSFVLRLWRAPLVAGDAWQVEVEQIQSGQLATARSLDEALELIRRAVDPDQAPAGSDPTQPPLGAS